ncbi:MAG: hypothetical protein GTO45_15655 [Candidatus Aminicenantes bacterium]|nr:hypothetical protein [Candidatus Aminicenantes bacterium]NIM80208.1 hypothetical protein [Candidatus Aminicenantes bacterium]NIN19547.1 hypothetical protein [Candidatus Aminicenantes bacterium]NIN43441.1 hypothetical protein [Candidatus Aminicenantes bacterium]NIN86186.1 hypothetical protein [Candidatus Aminicenantes bacterium]
MENITGYPVTHKDYLKTRLFLVTELKRLLRKCSVIIEAPRRFGKTSVIKEFLRQENAKKEEKREFNVLFLELEGEETVSDFCLKLFKELLNLYRLRKKIDALSRLLGNTWNAIAARLGKIKLPGFEVELREITGDYTLPEWKEKITPMITHLNSFDRKTIIVFDEFPDMLMNFKKKQTKLDYKNTTDSFTAWLRSLRQIQVEGCKYQFVFCGSIHLRKTLEEIGISKRINDLEPFVIPPIKSEDARLLIECLAKKYKLEIEEAGIAFMVEKITEGSLYYGQILVKALRETSEKNFSVDKVKAIYEAMLRRGNHDLNHYHSRLEEYLSHGENECSKVILKHLCSGPANEKEIYDLLLYGKSPYEQFQSVVNRLIYEGYISRDIHDNGNLRFVAPILKDWWKFKAGVTNVRL